MKNKSRRLSTVVWRGLFCLSVLLLGFAPRTEASPERGLEVDSPHFGLYTLDYKGERWCGYLQLGTLKEYVGLLFFLQPPVGDYSPLAIKLPLLEGEPRDDVRHDSAVFRSSGAMAPDEPGNSRDDNADDNPVGSNSGVSRGKDKKVGHTWGWWVGAGGVVVGCFLGWPLGWWLENRFYGSGFLQRPYGCQRDLASPFRPIF